MILYFGKTTGVPLTSAEVDTALAEIAKVTPGATVSADGKAVRFLFFSDDKSKTSENDQIREFGAALH